MKNTHSPTVDVSSNAPSSSARASKPPTHNRSHYGVAARRSLTVDAAWVLISLIVGSLFSMVAGTLNESVESSHVPLLPSPWFLLLVCAAPALLWSLVDILSLFNNPAALPFARSQSSRQGLYFQRAHTLLIALYFTAIVVALCWSAVTMPLISKLFVAAIFSFALYALGRSIPSQRTSFIVSGVLFLIVLVVTQLFIVMRLEADAGMANQRALDELLIEP
ncbi:MAG: hypothetical protein AAF703_01350 [Cyanobacteria bacterium P01_D01_bin.105]